MKAINDFLNLSIEISDYVKISVKEVLVLIVGIIITNIVIKFIRKIVNQKLEVEDRGKFKSIFTFFRYLIYAFIIILVAESSGINVSVILAGSAVILVGIGLALQTLFQDIISGIFILLDKTLVLNDIIEMDGKVAKILEIKLRTTRALSMDDKVLVIPNHIFLGSTLYNWTQNGKSTVEALDVGVAYGSDVELVRKTLIEAAMEHPKVIKAKRLEVFFMDFAESSLNFKLLFTINDVFATLKIKSDLRFAIDKKFKEKNIAIPFPQRDVHLYKS